MTPRRHVHLQDSDARAASPPSAPTGEGAETAKENPPTTRAVIAWATAKWKIIATVSGAITIASGAIWYVAKPILAERSMNHDNASRIDTLHSQTVSWHDERVADVAKLSDGLDDNTIAVRVLTARVEDLAKAVDDTHQDVRVLMGLPRQARAMGPGRVEHPYISAAPTYGPPAPGEDQ